MRAWVVVVDQGALPVDTRACIMLNEPCTHSCVVSLDLIRAVDHASCGLLRQKGRVGDVQGNTERSYLPTGQEMAHGARLLATSTIAQQR